MPPPKRILIVAVVLLAAALAALAVTSYHEIAIRFAPRKRAVTVRAAAALTADSLFWRTFHSGDYDGIPLAAQALTAAYLATPNDPVTAAHLAWLHNWRMAERARRDSVPATITDDIILARRYFEEAVALNPSDPRTLGFLAGHRLAEGNLHQDERLTRRGYFTLLDAIDAWPEFNLFTAGYIMSRLPSDSPRFRQAVEWQWQNLDRCVGSRIDRANPDYTRYMPLETRTGVKRVCWNSWIAPHNFEGFFLNFGDMLVKAGDPATAVKMYGNAKLTPDYATWPYKQVLEERIANAAANVEVFRRPNPQPGSRTIMVQSTYACMGCHQE
jgi:hypothetical protein